MDGRVFDDAAGAGVIRLAGGSIGAPPWPVVTGGGLLAVVFEESPEEYQTMLTNTAARIASTRMLSTPKVLESRYRGGFRPNPGSGRLGSWYPMSVLLFGFLLFGANAGRDRKGPG